MAQQTLQTVIALSGRVDNTFGAIGEALLGVGSQIDALSQKIINFGKESVEEYVNYDDIMRQVQALGEYDERTMSALDAYNRSIAQTSKYTMEQAGQAEVMMAQLGLNMDQTRTLMPTVMSLATAANIDLADSLDYLYYTLNSLGMPMDYANTLSDQMSKTAAISAADIDTLGQSMQRLGSSAAFFAGGSSEILAILGGIAQFGSDMQGSNAGTQLRNFMLTLLAPTQSKEKLISSLKVTEAEWAEFESYMEDAGINVTDTAAAMNKLGLSVYDSTTGELKPAIQIIGELDAALSTLPESEKNAVLGNLFGKRTTTTALNLIKSLSTIIDYKNQIENGSAGYTETMAETMEGGLGGALRNFTSSWNEFKVTIGETIAPEVTDVATGLTDIVNGLNNMDEGTLNALVSGATVLAAAGPGIIGAGAAFRLLGYILTPTGAVGLGLTAVVAAAAAIKELNEYDMAGNFGDMELDTTSLSQYVKTLGEDFKASYTEVNAFSEAVDTAVESYKTASTEFSSQLLSSMLTGTTLTEQDKTNLRSLGGDMHVALLEGITNSTAASMSYWEMLFGGEGTAEYDPQYQEIIGLTNTAYQNAIGEANSISAGFRAALTSAFDDSTISEDEYAELQNWMQAYNDAMARAAAEAQSEEDYINMQMLLHKAQTASLDSIKNMAQEIETERDSVLASAEETFLKEYYKLQYRGASDAELQAAQEQYNAHVTAQNAQYDDILLKLWESSMQQSDLSGAYSTLGGLADQYLAGELGADTIHRMLQDQYGNNRYAGEGDWTVNGDTVSTQLGEYLVRTIASLGGYEGITSKIGYYEGQGDTESANRLKRLYAMEQLINNFATTGVTSDTPFGWFDGNIYSSAMDEYATIQENRSAFEAEMGGYVADYTTETAKRTIEALGNGEKSIAGMMDVIGRVVNGENGYDARDIDAYRLTKNAGEEYDRMYEMLSGIYDLEAIARDMGGWFSDSAFGPDFAMWDLLYGNASANPEKYMLTAEVEPVVPEGAVQDAAGEQTIPATIEPETADATSIEVEVPDGAADASTYTTEFQGELDSNIPNASVNYPSGYADGVSYASGFQAALDANPIRASVGSSGSGSTGSGSKRSSSSGLFSFLKFAEGGRATTASIFGEEGPEWAIPEEHTERVASLLNAAREASGFTWPELITRNGGLNAGGSTPAQIIYSPTIIANDASGVEQKLIEDKERLDKWWKEKQMRDEVEVYV